MTNGNGREGDGSQGRYSRRRSREWDSRDSRREGSRSFSPARNSPESRRSAGRGGKNSRNERQTGAPERAGRDVKRSSRFRFDREKGGYVERPRWVPVKPPSEPLPVPECPLCGKPVKELSEALADKRNGEAIHFECARECVEQTVKREKGDEVIYIGGGRFGVIQCQNQNTWRDFIIKQVIEWEKKDFRTPWRRLVADRFSLT